MENKMNYKQLYEESMQRLEIISKISGAIALDKNSDDVWKTSLTDIVSIMGANVGSIYLLKDNKKSFYCAYEFSDSGNARRSILNEMDVSLLKDMPIMNLLAYGKSIKLDDISNDLNQRLNLYSDDNPYQYKSSICSPIVIGSTIDGAIAVSSKKPYSFSSDDLKVLDSIGRIIGTAFYNRQLLTELIENKNELNKAFHAIKEARNSERTRLSRELHDDIGQRLTSLSIRLKAIQQEQDIDIISDRLNSVRFLVDGALEELKRILQDLRPSKLTGDQTVNTLRELINEIACDSGIPMFFEAPENQINIPQSIEIIIFRSIQEGITNIIKHSKASLARITLSCEDQAILLNIQDNGVGLPNGAYENGAGLIGMTERVLEAQGEFKISSTKTGGTAISIKLPIII